MRAEELLSHADFMRHLARSLVLDEARAADITQQAWLAALKRPPDLDRPVRPWLSAVIRNLARLAHRSETRRIKREEAAALPEGVPSAEEVVEQEEVRARVVKAVLELKEPYRSAVLLRYYRDLSPREAAARLGVPVETVKTRLKRGLNQLRFRLDGSFGGDRKAWCLALAPVAGLSAAETATAAGLAPLVTGAAVMTAKAKIAVAAATILVASLALYFVHPDFFENSPEENPETTHVGRGSEDGSPGDVGKEADEQKIASLERVHVPPAQVADADDDAAASQGLRVAGKVTEPDGSPIAGAKVNLWIRYAPREKRSTVVYTEPDGSYAAVFEAWCDLSPLARRTAEVSGRAGAPQHLPSVFVNSTKPVGSGASSEASMDFVLKPGAALQGRVVDSEGRPRVASVSFCFMGSDDTILGGSGTDGFYEFGIFDKGEHRIFAMDYKEGLSECVSIFLDPAADAKAPDLVLRREGTIEGRAVYPDGNPVADVKLRAFTGSEGDYPLHERLDEATDADFEGLTCGNVKTDALGRFTFAGLKWGDYYIMDSNRGDKAEWIEDHEPFRTGDENVTVVLDPYRLKLRIQDEAGRPVPGAAYIVKWLNKDEWHEGTLTSHDGVRYFLVSPGDAFYIQATVEAEYTAEARVEIEEGIYETAVDLVMKPPREKGSLRFLVKDGAGRVVERFHGRLSDADSKAPVRRFREGELKGDEPLSLPEGRYILRVEPGALLKSQYFPVEREVVIIAGKERSVTLQARMGGWIRLNLDVPEDRAGSKIELGENGCFEVRTHDGRPPIKARPFCVYKGEAVSYSGSISPDESPVTQLLEPGDYTVYFKAEGYLPFEASAGVIEGEITDVKAALIPE